LGDNHVHFLAKVCRYISQKR